MLAEGLHCTGICLPSLETRQGRGEPLGVGCAQIGYKRDGLSFAQPALRAPVKVLPFSIGRIATARVVLQVSPDHWQTSEGGGAFDGEEEVAQGAEAQLRQACILLQGENLLYLPPGAGPASTASPEKESSMAKP